MNRASIVFALATGIAAIAIAQSPRTQGQNVMDVQMVKRFKDVNPQLVKARELIAKRDLAKAKEALEGILANVPEMSEAHFLMAKVLYGEKNYPESLASMEKAETTFASFGGLMMKMDEDRRSELQKRRVQQEALISDLKGRPQPLPLALQATLDRAEQLRSDIDRQLNESRPEALEVPAEYPFFHGNIFLRQQKYPEAAAKYEEALKADPKYADAANNLASLYYSAKQYQKAQQVLARVEAQGMAVNPELKKAITDAIPKP